MYLKIVLRPLEPYFFGGERNQAFTGGINSELSEQNPYFIRSNRFPSQTTLFGLLRYLGIENPDPSYRIDPNVIGVQSYDLFEARSYGMIHSISPLLLQDDKGDLYLPAPRNRMAAKWGEDPENIAPYHPFTHYTRVSTLDGDRLLPAEDYNEKTAYDGADIINLRDGTLRGNVFISQIRVGINRSAQRKNSELSGFFKKQYYTLSKGYAFVFFADVADGFPVHADRVVFAGQGRTPISVKIEKWEKPNFRYPAVCFSGGLTAIAQSDVFYPGTLAELRSRCALVMAELKEHRQFTTNANARNTASRYSKAKESLRLIPAGSVFLFTDTDQLAAFRSHMEAVSKIPNIAGLNHIQYGYNCLEEK